MNADNILWAGSPYTCLPLLTKRSTARFQLRDEHLLQLVGRIHVPRTQVLDLARRQPRLARVLLELGLAVDAAVGQQHEVGLNVALGVVGVGDIAGELVELRGADGADGARQAGVEGRGGRGAGLGAVAGGRLERREARLQGDVQQREGREAQ